MIQKLSSIKADIKELLERIDALRDNDALLVVTYYQIKIKPDRVKRMTAEQMLILIRDGVVPFPDAITRVRRKLQEKHPELRGVKYLQRKGLEEVVREGIKHL
jgi:hypothetical protein